MGNNQGKQKTTAKEKQDQTLSLEQIKRYLHNLYATSMQL
jgi:hypothetical protein